MKKFFLILMLLTFTKVISAQIPKKDFLENKCSRYNSLKGTKELSIQKNPLLHNYDVKFYKLDIEVSNKSDYVKGNVTINAEVKNNTLTTFVVELYSGLSVDAVLINNITHQFTHNGNEIHIPLSSSIEPGTDFSAQIFYYGKTWEGMECDTARYWGNWVTYTHSECFHAKDWFPCKEVLEDKADSVYVYVTTDYGLKAGSNGILTGTTYFSNGKVRYEWKSKYPIAYYLISIAVSDYIEYNIYAEPEGLSRPLLIQNYVYDHPECLPYYKEDIDITADLIELFSDLYGMYPFMDEKYGHCMWPWGGAMENQTMTSTVNFNFYLIAHELGHQWFGDYVTCATWQDIWINEGFASYTEYLAYQYLYSQEAADERMKKAHEYAMTPPDGSIYIPLEDAEDEDRIFDWYLSYRKGMSIVHMIRFELQNDEIFFNTLKNFLTQYGDSVASGIDFKNVLEETSGKDFTDFFNQWYFGEGYPTYNISWLQQNDTLSFTSIQTTSSLVTPLFKMLMEYKIFHSNGDTTIQVYQTENTQTFKVYLPYQVDSIQVDPNNWVLNQTGGIKKYTAKENVLSQDICKIYPNPSQGKFTVEIQNNSHSKLSIQVINETGQLIYERLYKNTKANSLIEIDLPDIPKGIYILRVQAGKYEYTRKIIIN
ncbi:MAG: T9SS type A sorting domain-containing protein [Bacteroidales bacterium]|nr:T9SS type A sorting domain-containing protein [Bacteroidales bacterium]